MNVVDSSGWLEYFGDGPNAESFAPAIEAPGDLVVPSVSVHEVFKRLLDQRSEGEALAAVAAMRQASIVDLTTTLAIAAARLSVDTRLPLADSVILATARAHRAQLWTQDPDFRGIPGVRFFERS